MTIQSKWLLYLRWNWFCWWNFDLNRLINPMTFFYFICSMFNERPVRAYSVGSRLEHNKRKMRLETIVTDHQLNNTTSRVRAFSVGSRAKVARSDVYKGLANSTNLTKANSQDIVNLSFAMNNNNKTSVTARRNQSVLNNNLNNNTISINNNSNSVSNHNVNNNNNIINNGNIIKSDGKKSLSTPFLANAQQRSRVCFVIYSLQILFVINCVLISQFLSLCVVFHK